MEKQRRRKPKNVTVGKADPETKRKGVKNRELKKLQEMGKAEGRTER